MSEVEDVAKEALEKTPDSPLNSIVALLVAVTATFMAICNIKDGNIVQTMAQTETRSVDSWAFYQAKSIKQHLAENALDQVRLRIEVDTGVSEEGRRRLIAAAARYEAQVKKYEEEKAAIRAEAEGARKEYERLNVHDDQLDSAEACFTIAIALYGITALTRKRWLLILALCLTGAGAIFGIAGFLGWNLHPDWLAKLLG